MSNLAVDHEAENLRLKRKLARLAEECDIPPKKMRGTMIRHWSEGNGRT